MNESDLHQHEYISRGVMKLSKGGRKDPIQPKMNRLVISKRTLDRTGLEQAKSLMTIVIAVES
jgi:hypothetical protein